MRSCLVVVLLVSGCRHAPSAAAPSASAADPCVDFYAYACGPWQAAHPIPADRSRISRYDEIIERDRQWTSAILETVAAARADRSDDERRVGDDYAACLDQRAIDARGLGPLRAQLDALDRSLAAGDFTAAFASLHAELVMAPFSFYVDQLPAAPDRQVPWLDQGGLGLDDRDDYLAEDAHSQQLRAAYLAHLERIFTLLQEPPADAHADAARVLALETTLARASLDAVTRRDPRRQSHPLTLDDIARLSPHVDWPRYFAALGVTHSSGMTVNVAVPEFLVAVDRAMLRVDKRDWHAYLAWHLADRATQALPAEFQRAAFDFYGAVVSGVRTQKPRDRRCQLLVDDHQGEAVGKLFVAAHFAEADRARVRAIVDAIVTVLRARIGESTWLGPAARAEALRKLDRLAVKIGHPDRWRDYSSLTIDRADAFGNDRRARAFELRRQVRKLDAPTDRDEWFELPHHLDGYSTRSLDEIAFTAGILQRPFFDPSADPMSQFGGIGAVVGHELTHLFDDQGRKFDADGALRDWWQPDEARRYEAQAACFADEYGKEQVLPGVPLNGALTLGENLADNGGLRLAWRAAHPTGGERARAFFLGWAAIRCENATEASLRQRARSDPHSPGRQRVNVVVSNMPEFAAAFACAPTAPMSRADRCTLW